jgi:hypothetical protein
MAWREFKIEDQMLNFIKESWKPAIGGEGTGQDVHTLQLLEINQSVFIVDRVWQLRELCQTEYWIVITRWVADL